MAGTTTTKPRYYPARDMRWLELRGKTWYAVMAVPRPLWTALGKRRMIKSLLTRDHHVAVARRHAALDEFQRAIEQARRRHAPDSVTEAALAWRDALDRSAADDYAACADGEAGAEQRRAYALAALEEATEEIEDTHGREAARAFHGIAKGSATPMLLHLDAWLREGGTKGPLNPRTQAQYRSDLADLAEWAKSAGISTVEGVTDIIAGRFVTQELVAKSVHWATANRKITAASSYWRWMRKRAGVTGNPWTGQSLAKQNRRGAASPKRPFTDIEVAALLAGNADAELSDLMRVAALSGMRIEEIYRLTVADCAGGWFDLRRSKTPAGIRRLPIHTGLAAIVGRRCEGKAPDAFLFHEAGPTRPGRERSAAVSKSFGRYRQVAVDAGRNP